MCLCSEEYAIIHILGEFGVWHDGEKIKKLCSDLMELQRNKNSVGRTSKFTVFQWLHDSAIELFH